MKQQLNLNNFITIVIALVMINNIEHIASVHYHFAQKVFPNLEWDILNKLHSVMVVVIVELSIIVFAIKGKKAWTLFFTFCIFILSLVYYDVISNWSEMSWQERITKIVLSIIFTVSIYIFSEMYAKRQQQKASLSKEEATIEQRKATANQLGLQIDKSRAEISEAKVTIGFLQEKQKQMNTKKSELNFEIEIIKAKRLELEEEKEQIKAELTCSNCKIFVGKNIRSLNAHVGKCK